MDGAGLTFERLAGIPSAALFGRCDQDGQVESVGFTARPGCDPQDRTGARAFLGLRRPGSEGTLASDNDNTTTSTPVTAPQEKPAENTEMPARETAAGDNHEKPERKVEERKPEERHTPRRTAEGREGKPVPENHKPAEHKATEHKPIEPKAAEPKAAEPKPAEPQPAEPKPDEQRPADVPPPADVKPDAKT